MVKLLVLPKTKALILAKVKATILTKAKVPIIANQTKVPGSVMTQTQATF